jgi:hypothetical protein
MRVGPRHREHAPSIAPKLEAHERRARLVAQIQEQAIANAKAGRLVQRTVIRPGVTKHSRWNRADRVMATGIIKVAMVAWLVVVIACIIVLSR